MADGWAAIHYAAMNGFINIVEVLVKEGQCDLNQTDRFHRSCLHWACRFNNVRIIECLLKLNIAYNNEDIEQ